MPAEIEPDVSPPTTKNSNPIASVSVEKDVAELGKVPPMVNEKISSPKANQMEVNRDKLRTSISSFDDEILDLDNFDSQEDEESW